jgi:hypothetical protein
MKRWCSVITGCLTAGQSVEAAAWWFIAMDRSCPAQLLAEAADSPVRIEHGNAILTRGKVGSHLAGWFQFQPLWNMIAREQPDLFE